MGDWGKMVPDVLFLIASRVHLFHDFLAFRGVCTSWRKVVPKEYFAEKSHRQPPLLMIAKKDNDKYRHFYCLASEKSRRMPLSKLYRKRCLETLGWLVMEDMIDGETELFHPFSRARIPLPRVYENAKAYPVRIRKAVLSTSPFFDENFVLVVIYNDQRELAFWRPGKQTWNRLETGTSEFQDILFYKDQFHAINESGFVYVLDFDSTEVLQPCFVPRPLIEEHSKIYLVESDGALLLVLQTWDKEHYDTSEFFDVYEIDISRSALEEIKDLGGRALFVGKSSSSSVDTCKFPNIKPNCIYHIRGLGYKDIGIYNLANEKTEDCCKDCKDQIFGDVYTLNWFTPSF